MYGPYMGGSSDKGEKEQRAYSERNMAVAFLPFSELLRQPLFIFGGSGRDRLLLYRAQNQEGKPLSLFFESSFGGGKAVGCGRFLIEGG